MPGRLPRQLRRTQSSFRARADRAARGRAADCVLIASRRAGCGPSLQTNARPPPRPFGCSTSAVAEAGRPAAHPRCPAGLTQAIESRAARHLAIQPIAEPRAANHEVVALRLGLKSVDAAGSWISRSSACIHDATFSQRLAGQLYHDAAPSQMANLHDLQRTALLAPLLDQVNCGVSRLMKA